MLKMVCVKALIRDAAGRVLVRKRLGDDKYGLGGALECPGGKVEAAETVLEALDREVLEETGTRVRSRRLLEVFDDSRPGFPTALTLLYRVEIDGVVENEPGREPWQWLSMDEIVTHEPQSPGVLLNWLGANRRLLRVLEAG